MSFASNDLGSNAVIELPYTKPPISMNDRGFTRGAMLAKAAKIAEVRDTTLVLARKAQLPRGVEHVTVLLHYRPRDNRRRDTDNLIATLKPICDALTPGRPERMRAGKRVPALVGYGMVADDTPRWMAKPEPIIHQAEKGRGGALWIELTWRSGTSAQTPPSTPVEPRKAVSAVTAPRRLSEQLSRPAAAAIIPASAPGCRAVPSRTPDSVRNVSSRPSANNDPSANVSSRSADGVFSTDVSSPSNVSSQVAPALPADGPVQRNDRHCHCTVCGTPIAQPDTGRPRKTCSGACRMRAARARSGAAGKKESGKKLPLSA